MRPDVSLADPERQLALSYAPAGLQGAIAAVWALDERLGAIVARGDNPGAAQIRLTWWHDALKTLHTARPVDPVLAALAEARSVDPLALLPLIDGWERLLDPLPIAADILSDYATERGQALFGSTAAILESDAAEAGSAGQLWSLVDLAFRMSDSTTAERAISLARGIGLPSVRLPRPLAILTVLARRDLRRGLGRPRRQGSPARVARALVAGLTGF